MNLSHSAEIKGVFSREPSRRKEGLIRIFEVVVRFGEGAGNGLRRQRGRIALATSNLEAVDPSAKWPLVRLRRVMYYPLISKSS